MTEQELAVLQRGLELMTIAAGGAGKLQSIFARGEGAHGLYRYEIEKLAANFEAMDDWTMGAEKVIKAHAPASERWAGMSEGPTVTLYDDGGPGQEMIITKGPA